MKSNLRAEQPSIVVGTNESTIGLDLGDRWSRYCSVDSAGTIAKEDRVRTTPEALEECFGKIPSSKIVIEAGMHSPWVAGCWRSSGTSHRGQRQEGTTDL